MLLTIAIIVGAIVVLALIISFMEQKKAAKKQAQVQAEQEYELSRQAAKEKMQLAVNANQGIEVAEAEQTGISDADLEKIKAAYRILETDVEAWEARQQREREWTAEELAIIQKDQLKYRMYFDEAFYEKHQYAVSSDEWRKWTDLFSSLLERHARLIAEAEDSATETEWEEDEEADEKVATVTVQPSDISTMAHTDDEVMVRQAIAAAEQAVAEVTRAECFTQAVDAETSALSETEMPSEHPAPIHTDDEVMVRQAIAAAEQAVAEVTRAECFAQAAGTETSVLSETEMPSETETPSEREIPSEQPVAWVAENAGEVSTAQEGDFLRLSEHAVHQAVYVVDEHTESLTGRERELWEYANRRNLSKREAGDRYQRYLGYLYECAGWKVEYYGLTKGVDNSNRGIDLICQKGDHIHFVQTKYWSNSVAAKTNINNVIERELKHMQKIIRKRDLSGHIQAVLAVKPQLSAQAAADVARSGVLLLDNLAIRPYPLVKCHTGKRGSKKYLLPYLPEKNAAKWDEIKNGAWEAYDLVQMDLSNGDCYVETPAAAEALGYKYRNRA